MGLDSLGDVGEHVAFLEPAGFDHRQGPFYESTPLGTLGAEAEFSPDDRIPQGTFSRVVGGLDIVLIDNAINSPENATSRGPDWPVGTPDGSAAQVVSLQHGQVRRCRWYFVTSGLISGSSQT